MKKNKEVVEESAEIDINKEIEDINKIFGKGSVFIADSASTEIVDTLSTGSLGLDFKTGIGGVPIGYVTEIIGANSTGKTTLTLHLAVSAQKKGGLVGFVDAEHELDLNYAKKLGVDLSKFVIAQPTTIEEGLGIVEKMLESNKFALIVFDSIASISTSAELENGINDLQTGDKAKLMSKHTRRINYLIGKSRSAIVYINQYRDSISFGYGSGKTTPGGHALSYRAKLRIELKMMAQIVDAGSTHIGTRIKARIIKNKMSAPFGEWEYTIVWGKGILEEFELIEIAEKLDVIKKSGAWYSFDGSNIGQGIWKTMEYIQSNPEVKTRIKELVLEQIGTYKDK
jgi:recombination protein RecA